MARKRGGGARRRRKYLKGMITESFNVGLLAAETVGANTVTDAVEDSTWVSSVKATWTLTDVTKATDTGPLTCGVAHSDYSAAEIEEWLENAGSWKQGGMIQQEIAKRRIRLVGTFQSAGAGAPAGISALNEGRPITTKCGWLLTEGQNMKFWWYNNGSVAYVTTGPEITINGHANLWPQ